MQSVIHLSIRVLSTHARIHPCSHLSIESSTHAVIHPCSHAPMQSPIHGVIHPCSHPSMESCTHAVIHLWSHAPMQSFIHGVMHPCSHPSMESFTHAVTHPWSHPPIQSSSHALSLFQWTRNLGLLKGKRWVSHMLYLLYSFVDCYKLMIVMIILTDDSALKDIPQDCIGQRVMMMTTIADCRPVAWHFCPWLIFKW